MAIERRSIGVGLLALLAFWAGARLYAGRHAANRPILVGAGQASPASALDLAATEPVPRSPNAQIPDRLPLFVLTDLSGKPSSIAQWSGKSLIINFWATWCAPCRHEVPLLQALAKQWADRGVTVVGVAVDYPDKVAAFAAQFKISYPLMVGDQSGLDVAAKFGMESPAFPFSVFTDRRGDVVALFIGELHPAQAKLILSQVADLNENRVQLAEARRVIADGLAALAAAPS